MDSKNHYDGFDEYAVKLIRHKARQLVGKFGFTQSDLEDLEQDLMLDLLHRLHKYDPARAQRNTFIDRIINHRVATIIEARKAGMRDYRLCTCSLNDPLEDDDGRTIERGETIDQDDYLLRTGKLSRTESELRDLLIDVRRSIDKLPPDLRELIRRLSTETVTEISRATGIPRGTIYDLISKIRTFCEDAGLKDYL